ncbi:MAG TPA: transcriptional repressor LexA [Firmicutes bacterium]|jgi:repressor LexA|nr:transcriptional repressor LexA [Bacillota bacterium]
MNLSNYCLATGQNYVIIEWINNPKGGDQVKGLTSRQQKVLNFIKEEVMLKNYPPSVREICAFMNLSSSSTVHAHLRALEKKGYIRRDPSKPRALEILDPATRSYQKKKARPIPILGQVTAGVPVLAEENIEDYLFLPDDIVKEDTVFMLRVRGESMKDAGILPGDLVIVRRQPSAESGEIVVALLSDEATIKRFYKQEDKILLKPENPAFKPIIIPASNGNTRILGKVVGLLRTYE